MKNTLVAILAALCVVSAQENYIHGGGNAFRGAFPSVVSVQHRFWPNFLHMCGGVILAERWVLTAAEPCADTISRIDIVAGINLKYFFNAFVNYSQKTLNRSPRFTNKGRGTAKNKGLRTIGYFG
jgi:hypothetical protein